MITIVGAGLVGSLWAIFLSKKGYKVQIFERRNDPRLQNTHAGRSINLVITSRGWNALETAGLLKQVRALAVPVFGRMIHSLNGETNYQPYGRADECNYSISRDTLNCFLINEAEQLGATFYFGHELQTLRIEEQQALFNTAKGTIVSPYEILFGADGAGSQVRKQLAVMHPSLIQEKTEWIEANYKELTLPLDINGKSQLQTNSLHIWPRGDRMMMALANLDGSYTVTLYLPNERFKSLTSATAIAHLFQTEFPDAIPLMPNVSSEFLENPQGKLGTVRCSQWVLNDTIALLGDAAHAIVPFFGQGMNCGFEDCTILNNLLESNTFTKTQNWAQLLRDYESIQKPNAQAIADMALENWVEMRDKVNDKTFLFRKKLESELEKKYPEIYKSRYGLVTYTLVPYLLAQKAGELQNHILDELIKDRFSTLDYICWQKADALINNQWQPFLEKHQLKINRYICQDTMDICNQTLAQNKEEVTIHPL